MESELVVVSGFVVVDALVEIDEFDRLGVEDVGDNGTDSV